MWGHKNSLPIQMSHKLYGIPGSCCTYLFSEKKKSVCGGRPSTNIKYLNYNILHNKNDCRKKIQLYGTKLITMKQKKFKTLPSYVQQFKIIPLFIL